MRVLTAVEGGCGAGADRVGVEGRRALTLAPPALGARSLPRPAPPPRRCPGSPPWLLSSLCLVFLCCCCCCPSLRCWQLPASQANSRQLRCRAAAGRIFQARNSANAQKGPLETLSPLLGVCSQAGTTVIFTLPNLLLAILLKCVFQLCLKRNRRKSLFLFEPFSQA